MAKIDGKESKNGRGRESKNGKGYKDYKKAFYSQLESVYLGVKIKDFHQQNAAKSGFNNLLNIKSEYFGEVKRRLEAKIAELFGENGDSGSAFLGAGQGAKGDESGFASEGQSANADKNGFSSITQSKNTDKNSNPKNSNPKNSNPKSDTNAEKNELYNKLYTFFDSYLNDTGTPFFNDTPIYKNIYARIYSNSKDTALFYKTQNLYYVKSDTLYESASLQDGRFGVVFDASEFAQSADNAKNKVNFWLVGVENSGFEGENSQNSVNFPPNSQNSTKNSQNSMNLNENSQENSRNFAQTSQNPAQNSQIPQNPQFTLTIKVSSQKALFDGLLSVFKTNSNEFSDDFLKALIDKGALDKKPKDADTVSLKKLFAAYKKQNEVDFFIHKNAGEFLKEQFDLFFYGYIFKDEHTQWEFERIDFLKKLREIALYAIKLIADFENELKALWLKPKFAKTTQFVFSIDAILRHAKDAHTLLERIFKDEGFENQIAEWRELGLIAQNPTLKGILEDENSRFLPIDTKFLSKEGKNALLCGFEDLRAVLCGELIKGDNFQALNTLMPKYQGRVDLIYIDPPFNLGENASFEYKVNFKDSTWASLLDSRLELSKQILSDRGSIFVRCDYNGNFIVRSLLNDVFGEDNFINEIVVSKSAKLTETIKKYHSGNDSLFFFGKTDNYIFNVQGIQRNERKWRDMHLPGERWSPIPNDYIHLFSKDNLVLKNGKYTSKARIILGKELLPPNGRHWALSQETIFTLEKQGGIRLIDSNPKTQESDIKKLTSNWTDWVGYSSDWGFQTENHEKVLQRAILTGSNENSIILDFFAGSGTTCAVALKLGRKFVGVEMGEHFYKVILPRLKKVIAGVQSGISKECEFKGGGAFCYYELESYEDALRECEYVLGGNSRDEGVDFSPIIDYRKSRKLIKELSKKADEFVRLDMSGYRAEFDIFMSVANARAAAIKRFFMENDELFCEFEDGKVLGEKSVNLNEFGELKRLIWWKSDER